MRASWGWASILAITVAWPTAGQAQDVGNCITPTGPCAEQSECDEGELCVPAGPSSLCVKLGEQCKDSSACGRDGLCVAMYGSCKTETQCEEGDACGPTGKCMTLLGEPSQPPDGDGGVGSDGCKEDGDCRPGDRCAPMGFCIPPRECEDDGQCGEGGQCDKELGLCIPPDCGGDPVCEQVGPTDCGSEPCAMPTGGGVDGPGNTGGDLGGASAGDDAKDKLDDAKEDAANKEIAALCSVQRVGAGQAGLSAAMLLFSVSTFLSRRSRRRK